MYVDCDGVMDTSGKLLMSIRVSVIIGKSWGGSDLLILCGASQSSEIRILSPL